MASHFMQKRQTQFAAYTTAYILVVLAILSAINWLGTRHSKSIDTTANKRYSLSEQTEKIVKNLKQDVKISFWDSPDQFRGARDLLDRYDSMSDKLTVEYVDGNKMARLAREKNIRQPGTILVESGNNRQEAKSLTEEEVTGAMVRLLKGTDRQVCFVQGSGERDPEDSQKGSGYAQAKALLERNNYKTETISLLEKREIPATCTITIVAGPRFDYPAEVVKVLQDRVEQGGAVLFMVDPPLQLGAEKIATNTGLIDMLSKWGVTLNPDLIIDDSRAGQMFGLSEATPLVASYDNHPIVREMSRVATAFPLVRSLEVKSGGEATAQKLFSTLASSFSTRNLASAQIAPSKDDKQGPLAVAAAGAVKKGRFVVVGSSMFISNSILRFQGNSDLFLNMCNWLSADEDLISIRPKDPDSRPMTLTRAQILTIRTFSQFVLPLLAIGAGIMVWLKRR
jgi:ABC-type uncharacterized transport system involved in gliding motility auxiliary subunit